MVFAGYAGAIEHVDLAILSLPDAGISLFPSSAVGPAVIKEDGAILSPVDDVLTGLFFFWVPVVDVDQVVEPAEVRVPIRCPWCWLTCSRRSGCRRLACLSGGGNRQQRQQHNADHRCQGHYIQATVRTTRIHHSILFRRAPRFT